MNLKLPVFAGRISNLSDARFFSAYGVDWMSFICNTISTHYIAPVQIKEILNWLSGPKICINVIGCHPDEINQLVDELKPDGVLVDEFQAVDALEEQGLQIFRQILVGTDYSAADLGKHKKQVNTGLVLNFETNSIPFTDQQIQMLQTADLGFPIYVDAQFSLPILGDLVNNPVCGVYLRGGLEDKVGIRSFGELQDFMEFLEQLD